MKRIFLRTGCFFILLWPAHSLVRAQPAVEVSFTVYVWNKAGVLAGDSDYAHVPELFVWDGDRARALRTARGQVSPSYRFEGDLPLRLVAKRKTVEEGQSPYIPYATVRFPPQWTRVMIMVNPDDTDANGQVRVGVVNMSDETIPKGKATFYNGSNEPLRLLVRDTLYTLPVGGHLVLNRKEVQAQEVRGMAAGRVLVARPDPAQGWKIAANQPVYVKPDESNFFFISERGRRISIQPFYNLGGGPG